MYEVVRSWGPCGSVLDRYSVRQKVLIRPTKYIPQAYFEFAYYSECSMSFHCIALQNYLCHRHVRIRYVFSYLNETKPRIQVTGPVNSVVGLGPGK